MGFFGAPGLLKPRQSNNGEASLEQLLNPPKGPIFQGPGGQKSPVNRPACQPRW